MSQHDYDIANAIGPTIRTDLNSAFAAIVSNNSGATEPATPYAYMWWADTTTGLLKRRNSTNTAWVTIMSLDSLTFASPTLTGTTQVAALTASGLATLNGGATVSGNIIANGVVSYGTGGNVSTTGLKFLRPTDTGLGAGFNGYATVWPENVTPSATNYAMLVKYDSSIVYLNSTNTVALTIGATPVATATSTGLAVTGALSATTTGKVGTTLGVGNATPAASGAGITFPATQSASTDVNTLDDYREATYTATATGMTTSPTGSVGFVKVGNAVTMEIPTISGTSNATTFTLTGMPTTCRPSATRICLLRVNDNGGASAMGYASIGVDGVITLQASLAGAAFTNSGTKGVYTCFISYFI